MKKRIIGIVVITIAMLLGFGMKLFIIGAPANENSLAVQVEEGDGQIAIYIQSTDSAMSISNIQYRYEGTVLHLTVYKVLCSPMNNDGDKCLYYEITDESEIWLGNKLIWTAY